MYNLGEHFKVKNENVSSNLIFKGDKYRISILSNSLVRIEYNEFGAFLDSPTQLVRNRKFDLIKLDVKEDDKYLEIKTTDFTLYYTKNMPYKNNIKIVVNGKEWRFDHPEARRYEVPGSNINSKYMKGLYSLDGFVSIDDYTYELLENGEYRKREGEYIDKYIFLYGNDFNKCLKDYFNLTGYPTMMPRYAFGIWWSKDKEYSTLELKELVTLFKENNIPLSAIILDHYWHVNVYNKNFIESGFTFNGKLIDDPINLTNYLHSSGIRIGLTLDPSLGFYPFEASYNSLVNYLNKDEKGIIPFNAINPKDIDVYLKILIHPLDNIGIDFYYNDTKEINNNYWLVRNANYIDMERNYQKRPIVIGKKTGLVDHRYGIVYTGKTNVDFKTLNDVARYNVLMSNMGLNFYTYDVGGFEGGFESSDLYTRSVQLGTFSPIFKFGSGNSKYYKREPWRWDTETYEITKYYLNLRQKMILYLYNEAYDYSTKGKLLIEPIYYSNPAFYDDDIYKNEYFLGESLLIAPILNKMDEVMKRTVHKFYIPDGVWYDFSTGKKYPGNHKYISFYKLKDYPVFVKAGAIIPFGYNENINDTNSPSTLEIQIFPGKSNTYELYEDDGVSSLYKQGYFIKTEIEYNYFPNNYTVIIRPIAGKSNIIPDRRDYRIVFRNVRNADEVIVYEQDMKILPKTYSVGPNFIVEVSNIRTVSQLTINCKGKDIEIDAVKIIDEDIEAILNDLNIDTSLKDEIDKIIFGDDSINKKRIRLRKLRAKGLDYKNLRLFLRLLEHIKQL